MPLSRQVHKDDPIKGDQQPGHAILAFVSLAEKNRFLMQFDGLPIRHNIAITMYSRRLICNRVHSSSDGRYNSWCHKQKLDCSKEDYDEGHVAGSGECTEDLTFPSWLKNGVADPRGVYYDAWGNLCGTHSPSIPTTRAPTSGAVSYTHLTLPTILLV